MRVGLVTLGCDKNTVDNEYLAGLLGAKGMTVEVAEESNPPDVVVITTCGFLQAAKDQSREEISRWVDIREKTGTRLGVIGCLAQRNGNELLRDFPQIDFLAGVGDFERVANMVAGEGKSQFLANVGGESWELTRQSAAVQPGDGTAVEQQPSEIEFDDRAFTRGAPKVLIPRTLPRQRIDKRPHGFLKISDGCNHTCTFCSIPLMKGIYTSVPRQVLLDETRRLLDDGVREINIVAQDITKYGLDTEKRLALPGLLNDLANIEGDFWIRLFYLYPSTVTRDLIGLMKEQPKIARYLDIPLQHLDAGVLRRMKRPHDRARTMDMLRMIRSELPEVTLRTTFIVGFPGETRQEFQVLLDSMDEIRFERLGVFTYSREAGTEAAALPSQITEKVKMRRRDKIMKKQAEISLEWTQNQVGKRRLCLVEGRVPDSDWYVARSESEAADIDGVVRLYSEAPLKTGDFVQAEITAADVYDLEARAL
ncbi:MAG: 30S ribosomal protein S12 methylthiotransferase RimO [Candidatus Sumerlaeia bacterium]|nr:30S ribosomal protein S12 methylthiotransferase RimO [Candidatus Sumerlaeia bacterium]